MTSKKIAYTKLVKISEYIFLGLLVYMPLHIFLSTWLGTSFNILAFTKIAKDILMVMGFLFVLQAAIRQKWFSRVLRTDIVIAIVAYAALTVVLALVKPIDQGAELLGVVYNTRFLLFFLYAVLLGNILGWQQLRQKSIKAVMLSGFIVVVFGFVQYTWLPNNALSHVGYARINGVLPAFFIDDKPDLERIMSTLRDPNSLGSYVIIIGSLSLALLLRKKQYRNLAVGFLLLSILCVWFTFSRSALLGFAASVVFISVLGYKKGLVPVKWVKPMIISTMAFFVMAGVGAVVFRNSYFVQNVVFHADKSTVLEDPNELRVKFWRESIAGATKHPLGKGPGTAGIVSIRNTVQGPQLNENYYLQVLSEVGFVGLLLFIYILYRVGGSLVPFIKQDWVALALFAAFIGLAITNFLVHIWSNEAVAYTWWGLAGIILAQKFVAAKKSLASTRK